MNNKFQKLYSNQNILYIFIAKLYLIVYKFNIEK